MVTANTNSSSLTVFERGAQLLAEANTIQKARELKSLALSAAEYAKQMKLGGDAIQSAKGYALEAERKMGEMLKESAEKGERETRGGNRRSKSADMTLIDQPKLADIGLTKQESHNAQRLADVPDAIFVDLKNGKVTRKVAMRKKSDKVLKPHYREAEIVGLHDNGLTNAEIATEIGIGKRQVRHVIERKKIERNVAPTVTPDMLAMTARQKLELAIKQHKEKLSAQWQIAVRARVDEILVNSIGPRLQQEQNQARYVMKSRKGVMDRESYKKILACLHPDRINQFITNSKLRRAYDEAWHIFRAVEKRLLDERNSTTEFATIPTTAAEWDSLKRQTSEARNAKRNRGGIVRK